jgi:preprotein translocase subunit SecA
MEKLATLTALRILNIRITLPNGMTVSPDQLQLKSQEQIDAERKAAEAAQAAAAQNGASDAAPAEGPTESAEQMSAEGAKPAGLAGQAATSETNAISEEQQDAQPMPQSALPGTRPTVRRTYTNPAVAAAARRAQQQAAAKLGRNDPCWCGSGLKYKKCHGKDME